MKRYLWPLALLLVLVVGGLLWRGRKVDEFPRRAELRFAVEVRNATNQWFDRVEIPIVVPRERGPWYRCSDMDVSDPARTRDDVFGNREAVVRFSDFEKGAVRRVSFRLTVHVADLEPVMEPTEDWLRYSVPASGHDALGALRAEGRVVRWVAGIPFSSREARVGQEFERRIERQLHDAWMPLAEADPLFVFRVSAETEDFESGMQKLSAHEGFEFRYGSFELR